MTATTEHPPCAACKGELLYDVKMEAIDGESIENGYSLRVAVVCGDCGLTATPTEEMRAAMVNLAAVFVPPGYSVARDKAAAETEKGD